EIRKHNRATLEAHPLSWRIQLIEGSSTDPSVVAQVAQLAEGRAPVVVILDSMHTHDHVLNELRAYAPLVTPGSYLIVFDTVIGDLTDDLYPDRPWGRGNNPKTAVHAFLAEQPHFRIDRDLEDRLLFTAAPDGYLLRERA